MPRSNRSPSTRQLPLALIAVLLISSALLAASPAQARAACATLCPLAVFDDYANGSLRSQGPWQVNTPGATDGAVAGDDLPPGFSGKAMINRLGVTPTPVRYRGNAYASLGELAVPATGTGTLFFEFQTEDLAGTDLNLGLSADASPGLGFDTTGDALDLDDYAVQLSVRAQGLVIRDGTTDRVADTIALRPDTGYRLWVVVDNRADTFQVHAAEAGGTPVLLAAAGRSTFGFRSPGTGPLVTFLHLNNPDNPPTAVSYLDNIFVDPTGSTLTDPSPAYETVLDFNSYATGALGGQDGWLTSSSNVVVAADPADAGNRVLRATGANLRASRAVPAIPDGAIGTVFLRLRRAGNVDTNVGLTDVDTPTAFGDYEVQANNQNSGTLNARNGGAFTAAGQWVPGAWQCLWLVADNAADRVTVYSRGGPYPVTTRLPADPTATFAFRNGTAEGLDRFLLANGANSSSALYVDDLAVDTTGVNLRVPGGRADSCAPTTAADVPLTDPLPGNPQVTGVGVTLREVTTIPATGGAPAARVNYVGEIPDGSRRLYVPDLNGRMYLVAGGTPVEYLDVAARFPDFRLNPSLGTGFGFVAFHPEFATNGRFYTVHTEAGAALTSQRPDLPYPANTSVHGVITEWTATDPSANTFAGSRREVLRLGFDTFLHGIQQIDFNPTAKPGDADHGLLYVAVGDGEEVPNFTGGPQNLAMPQGKLLRIDPLGTGGAGGGYGVPAGNPFAGTPGRLGEIYAYGLRNPHRFSWDRLTTKMYLGMIGEANIDSIYEVVAGDNYGWNEREGGFRFKKDDPTRVYALPADDARYGYTYPVISYDHDTGNAMVGGFVYRGRAVPELYGKYVYGDIVSGRVFYSDVAAMRRGGPLAPIYELSLFDPAGAPTTMRQLAGNARVDFRTGIDADGELFISAKANAKIWRVTRSARFAACTTGSTVVTDVAGAANWAPVTPAKWRFTGGEVVLAQAGTARPGPRRPYEYAVLTAGPRFGVVQLDAEVRLDAPVSTADRDVVLVFGHRSDTQFYYVHLSQDNKAYAHNGIFRVDNADRFRIEDQWTGSVGAPPAVTDTQWHRVRVRHCAATGQIAVWVDGADTPLMTATDTTFGSGRVGFGSFDNVGRLRNLTVTGTPAG